MNADSLRVMFISDAIQGRNGVGTYYDDLVSHLRKRLHRVELVAPHASRREPHQGLSIPIPGDPTQRLYFPRPGSLRRLMKEVRPHALVVATIGPYGLLGIRHAQRLRIPACVGFHTDFEKLTRLYWSGVWARIGLGLIRWAHHRLLPRGSIVVTYNKQAAHDAWQDSARVRLVGTPVSRRFLTAPTQPLRPQLQTILFLGRLAPEKNVHLMLAAAEQLPALRFLFGGDGPLRPQVERAASRLGNVEYRGWLNRAEVLAILDEADLLVLPSSVESFGTVALEALARRRLVLVSRHCGIRDWPHLFQCVFVIGEDETVTDAIRRVQRCDYRFRETMAQKGRHAAHDMSDLAVDQWLDIFAELTPDLFQEPKFDLPTHHGPGGDVRPRPDAANVASGV